MLHHELASRVFIGEASELVISFGSETVFSVLGTGLQIGELRQEVLGVVRLVQLRLIWWSHGLAVDLDPIDLLEPGVRLDFFGVGWPTSKSLVRVFVEQLHAEVASIVGQKVVIESGLSILNVLVKLLAVFRVERRETNEHLVNNGAERPPVSCLAMALSLEHLWGEVLSSATEGLSFSMARDSHL